MYLDYGFSFFSYVFMMGMHFINKASDPNELVI